MQIPIKRAMEKVPGGMMVVPLLAGALIATFFPDTPKFFGSFTGALFSGALTILAVFYVCMGASIDFRATPYIVKKGGTLLLVSNEVGMGIVPETALGRRFRDEAGRLNQAVAAAADEVLLVAAGLAIRMKGWV